MLNASSVTSSERPFARLPLPNSRVRPSPLTLGCWRDCWYLYAWSGMFQVTVLQLSRPRCLAGRKLLDEGRGRRSARAREGYDVAEG